MLGTAAAVALVFNAFAGSGNAQQALAPDAPQSQAATQPEQKTDRVVITAMVPVPNVGEGAPYRTLDDIMRMKDEATGQRGESIRDIQQYRRCRQQQSDFSQRRLSDAFPSLEGLLEKEIDLAFRVSALAGKAEAATRAAEDSRRRAADGEADVKTVEAAELARQDAINKLDEARLKYREAGAAIADFQELQRRGRPASANGQFTDDNDAIAWTDLDIRAAQRREAGWWDGIPAPDIPKGLAIAGIEARQFTDRKGVFIEVTGEIRNSGAKAASVPDLVVSALDGRGWVVEATPLSAPPSVKIPAGGSKPFAYQMRPPPAPGSKIAVSFGSKIAPPSRLAVATPDC